MRILLVLLLFSTNVFAQTKYLPPIGPISFSATKKAFFEANYEIYNQYTLTNVNGVETNDYSLTYFSLNDDNTNIVLNKDVDNNKHIVRIFTIDEILIDSTYHKDGTDYKYYKFKYRDLFTEEIREMEQLRGIENQDTTLMLHDIYYDNYYFKN